MSKQTDEQSWSFCPMCNHWVPTKYFIAEWDEADQTLTRMCNNCAHDLGDMDLPTFKHKPHRYEPNHEKVKCPFCATYHDDTREINPRAPKGDPDRRMWLCGNSSCQRKFKLV